MKNAKTQTGPMYPVLDIEEEKPDVIKNIATKIERNHCVKLTEITFKLNFHMMH